MIKCHTEENNINMELLNIKISRFTDKINGVKLYETESLLVVLLNSVDFVLDGICFINKRYVKQIDIENNNELKVKILKHKIKSFYLDSRYESFETVKDAINYFLKINNKLIEVTLESPNYSIIGNIVHTKENYFIINMLSIKGKYLNKEKIEYNKTRILTIDSDYLNSLEYYIS